MTRAGTPSPPALRDHLETRVDGVLSPDQHARLRLGGAAAWHQARDEARQRALDARARDALAAAAAARTRQLATAERAGAPAAGPLPRARAELLLCRRAALTDA